MVTPLKGSHSWNMVKFRQHSRRNKRTLYMTIAVAALFLGTLAVIIDYSFCIDESSYISEPSSHYILKRSAVSNTTNITTTPMLLGTTMPNIGNYPKDVFKLKQLRKGAVLLHTAGMIYMFVALAIVCDEFFVPALEVITEKLDLTEDVAGATFMAAGGSAPELFTSIAGLFLSENEVGISTIIGSAVFNILFVIGVCGIAAKELLQLTWWPLFRDSCFYSISLIILIISYLNGRIHYYEALALLMCYASYVTFMRFNKTIEKKVKSLFCKASSQTSTVDLVPVSSITSLVIMVDDGNKVKLQLKDQNNSRPTSSLKFRAGLLQLMIHTIDPLGQGKIEDRAMHLKKIGLQGNTPDATLTHDQNGNTHTENSQRPNQLSANNTSNGTAMIHEHPGSANSNHSTMTSVEIVDEMRMDSTNNNGLAKTTPIQAQIANGAARDEQAEHPVKSDSEQAVCTATSRQADEDDDDDNAPLDLSWPKSTKKRITYVLLAPIIFLLWLTLPDTRRPEKRKYFPITFIGSILWIAFFSIMMVWWASVICVTIGMPVSIIGLTVLAAGTSVPDLLTSVIVARKGFGDMAISSSIGSNIFDITVGLPLPWLIGCLMRIPHPYVNVDATALLTSIMLLFGMLLTTVGSIAVFKWKLNKILGSCMVVMYFVFVTVSVLLALSIIPDIKLPKHT